VTSTADTVWGWLRH